MFMLALGYCVVCIGVCWFELEKVKARGSKWKVEKSQTAPSRVRIKNRARDGKCQF